ncbi:MAG TPA: hypothetical protein VLK35_04550 [Methylomirabilota bacterium]|nr:hypothetical protein [Methylomirabilota bacterium]
MSRTSRTVSPSGSIYGALKPLGLLSELLLVSGLVLRYCRDWRRAVGMVGSRP